MAKGNDGNLLQHTVEAELAVGVCRVARSHGLHVVLTHGMEPFEACAPRGRNPGAVKKLEHWLVAAQGSERMDASPAIVRAYHLTQASLLHYPNSAEVLAAILGRSNLMGWVCEADQQKASALKDAWLDSGVTVLAGSWRSQLERLHCPSGLSHPWLISMDPMTWVENSFEDDDKLRQTDLEALRPVLRSYSESRQPGAAAVFCYSLTPARRASFQAGVQATLASAVPAMYLSFLDTVARGGNKHTAAVLCTHRGILDDVITAWGLVSAARHDGERKRS